VSRSLLFAVLVVVFPVSAHAETMITETEFLIRLNVSPKAAPKPALRYVLLPELKELTPGNPIPNYLRCLLDQDNTARQPKLGVSALRLADRAARMDKPDWQILLKVKTDGIGLLLPDLQKIRELAAGLQERFHNEVVHQRFDDGLRTARTMFAMSRHTGEHPTLIGDLVGIAIAFVAIGPLEEMLEQPGCPNLYWALTSLPNPLISIDKGLEGERALIRSEFRELDDKEPMTEKQIKKMIFHIDNLRDQEGKLDKKVNGARAWIDARSKNKESIRAAQLRLIEYGISEERVKRFPTDQVMLLDGYREYEILRDEVMKRAYLPTWQFDASDVPSKSDYEKALLGFLVPALQKVRSAQGRLEQRIALLRHVEAIRMYAAAHDGKLPAKLADCPVPLPNDPTTGKPFRYQVDGNTAHLRGTPPKGMEKINAYNVHYELTIKK
jgi:hypothetical protein